MATAAAAFSNVFSLALFAALLLSPSVLATPVKYCEKDNDYEVKVSGVDISPFPIVRSRRTTFSLSASTASPENGDKAITGGNLQIDVSLFGINIYSQTIDLCKETSCPVSAGNFVLTHRQTLPWLTPPGSYTLKMQVLGADGKKMSCITFDFSIGFVASVADV
ncbi:hypothetical protein ACLOJK_033547 [Asimina triloba]